MPDVQITVTNAATQINRRTVTDQEGSRRLAFQRHGPEETHWRDRHRRSRRIPRAVNRALRNAYGIGICSVEEIGSFAEPAPSSRESKKLPPWPVNGKNGNYGGPKVRDRLCQLIRQHELYANLVKSYAVDFYGTKTLREAFVSGS
jgi:hypothetical protein